MATRVCGISSETLTEMLQDNIQTIVLNSRGAHETAPEGMIERNLAETIAEVLHLKAPIQEIRGMLGQVTYEVSIDFVRIGDNLFLENSHSHAPSRACITHKEVKSTKIGFSRPSRTPAKWVMRSGRSSYSDQV